MDEERAYRPGAKSRPVEMKSSRSDDDTWRPYSQPPKPRNSEQFEPVQSKEEMDREDSVYEAKLNSEMNAATPEVSRKIGLFLGALVTVVAGWVLARVVFLINDAWQLSPIWRVPALLCIGVVLVALGWIIWSLTSCFRSLPRIDPVNLSPGNIISKAEKTRLMRYLLSLGDIESYIKNNGFGSEAAIDIRRIVQSLLADNKYSSDMAWADDFKKFAEIQTARADKCIQSRWGMVGIKTAASPWQTLDMLIVIYHSAAMTKELAGIYHRKITTSQTYRLAFNALLAVAVSGMAQDAAESAVEMAGSVMESLKGLLSKTAEGTANAILVRRLGCRIRDGFSMVSGQ